MQSSRHFFLLVFVFAACFAMAQAPSVSPQPAASASGAANSDPTYQALRRVGLKGEGITVKDLQLKRDAGTFLFRSGTFCFAAPVNGKVTGAVFNGEGRFNLEPPIELEKKTLKILTKSNEPLSEEFSQLALRFTDDTYQEVKKASVSGSAGGAGCSGGLDEINNVYRHDFHYNIAARLLQDVLAPQPVRGGYFGALIKGKHYSGKEMYLIDPYGVIMEAGGVDFHITVHRVSVAPEEVAFVTFEGNKSGTWTAFHFSEEYKNGTASGSQRSWPIHIEKQNLKTRIEKTTKLDGDAETTFVSTYNGLRVVPFDLFSTLRVQKVTDANGQPLSFIQEEKNDDPLYVVILTRELAAGERFTIHTVYEGKDALLDTGGGNFYPIARTNWYPSSSFGDYAEYEMEFRIPKGLTMVASGSLLKQFNEGDQAVSQWKTEAAEAVAGFSYGKFNKKEIKLEKLNGFLAQSFANSDIPDMARSARDVADDPMFIGRNVDAYIEPVGTLSTAASLDKPLAEAQMAIGLYTAYFGPLTYKHVAVTQQTACFYGQSWPTLVYLPMCAFYDSTQRHAFRMDDVKGQFWEIVGPHELAHQWWGHMVGFNSYRDQWISEGFAELSASIFIQAVYGKTEPDRYAKIWSRQRELLTERNAQGWRAIDVPITLGYRGENSKTGDVTRRLIYPKGAYILHMIRMMMWNDAIPNHDQTFQEMMHDFTHTYTDRVATTEDFKAMVEKHMTDQMNLDNNKRMDWFFNEYVYGTGLPAYKLDYSFKEQNGTPVLSFKITQSNVDKDFKMLVPLYVQLADGRILRLGSANITGNGSFGQDIPLTGVKQTPKKAMINHYYDVLATEAK